MREANGSTGNGVTWRILKRMKREMLHPQAHSPLTHLTSPTHCFQSFLHCFDYCWLLSDSPPPFEPFRDKILAPIHSSCCGSWIGNWWQLEGYSTWSSTKSNSYSPTQQSRQLDETLRRKDVGGNDINERSWNVFLLVFKTPCRWPIPCHWFRM